MQMKCKRLHLKNDEAIKRKNHLLTIDTNCSTERTSHRTVPNNCHAVIMVKSDDLKIKVYDYKAVVCLQIPEVKSLLKGVDCQYSLVDKLFQMARPYWAMMNSINPLKSNCVLE